MDQSQLAVRHGNRQEIAHERFETVTANSSRPRLQEGFQLSETVSSGIGFTVSS